MVVQQCAGTPCQHIQLFDPLSSSLTKKKKTKQLELTQYFQFSNKKRAERESGVKSC